MKDDLAASQGQAAAAPRSSGDEAKRLLPCPFCGHSGDDLKVYHNPKTILHPWYRIECDWCGAEGPGSDHGDHVEQWNTRAASSGATSDSGKVLVAAAQDATQTSEQDDPNQVGD
jgi:Lar family restriction alleviation protein